MYLVLYNIFHDLNNSFLERVSISFAFHSHESNLIILIFDNKEVRYKTHNNKLPFGFQEIQKLPLSTTYSKQSNYSKMVTIFFSTWKLAIFFCTADNSRKTLIKSPILFAIPRRQALQFFLHFKMIWAQCALLQSILFTTTTETIICSCLVCLPYIICVCVCVIIFSYEMNVIYLFGKWVSDGSQRLKLQETTITTIFSS